MKCITCLIVVLCQSLSPDFVVILAWRLFNVQEAQHAQKIIGMLLMRKFVTFIHILIPI